MESIVIDLIKLKISFNLSYKNNFTLLNKTINEEWLYTQCFHYNDPWFVQQ